MNKYLKLYLKYLEPEKIWLNDVIVKLYITGQYKYIDSEILNNYKTLPLKMSGEYSYFIFFSVKSKIILIYQYKFEYKMGYISYRNDGTFIANATQKYE